jgi:ATP-dependent RNA helicase DeaD
MKFSELNLSFELNRAIEELGYTEATPVQAQCIPPVLEGRDVIGQSQTGTGKTAAFGLPLLEKLVVLDKRTPQILIMTPTRELALQVSQELRKFAKYKEGVKIVTVYGGDPITGQIRDLKGGADIIVGTPGRIQDHIDRRTLKFHQLKALVLDEADEMLKMGFKEAIEQILQDLPEERQTLLFSATMPKAILDITNNYQNNPVHIKTKQKEMTVNSVEQVVYEVNQGEKVKVLVQLMEFYRPESSMIFCNTKKMVDDLSGLIASKGYSTASIHGDMKQEMRSLVMAKFKDKKVQHLICTDVAARGIDIDGLDMVFNFDVPQETEYYVHRIGRTGRAGKSGISVTLVTPRQRYVISELERLTKAPIERKEMPSLNDIQAVRFDHMTTDIMKTLKADIPVEIKTLVEKLVDQGLNPIQLSEALLYKVIGADIFVEAQKPIEKQRRAQRINSSTIELDVGLKHGIAAAHLVSAIAEASGISGKDIGKIRIQDRYSHVEVPQEFVKEILEALNQGTIKSYKVKAFEISARNTAKPKHKDYPKNFRPKR